MTYTFNTDLAEKYGLEEAIMLQHIGYWVLFNKAHDKNFKDGRYWTWTTLKGLNEIFRFWSMSTIRRVLKSLKEQGCIITGCYNERAADRTLWYSLADEVLENEQFHLLKSTNESVENNAALPDIKTKDNKQPDIYTPLISPQGETPQEPISKKENSAKAKPSAADPLLVLPFSEHKAVSAWYELCTMPKWKNKPRSAIEKVLKKLSRYSDDVVLAAIEDAIMGNYQGIFPDKFVKKAPLAPQPPTPKYIDIKDIM